MIVDIMEPWAQQQAPPIGGSNIVLKPSTFARHDATAKYIQDMKRLPTPVRWRGKMTWVAPGAWGWLAPDEIISGCSGLTLGSGKITFCTRDGEGIVVSTKDEDKDITIYNTCSTITGATGTGTVLPLHWIDCWVIG